jgi:diaminohydroxyphosphoribosylaminopyrimidine deaminase/5-amino-6-(5-phosphoribosylamino)uracil reductase
MFSDEDLMLRCIRLARNGRGNVSPNPMVGCVIVKDGKIIGEGYHAKFGEAHAEVNAIRSASESVEGADVYVNLEPCSYYGKTPPCADLLIERQVRKVYVGMLDPNPRVDGKGIERLRAAGIEVEVGLSAQPAERLNEVFTKFISKKLPFVTLKVAQSLDGKIAVSNRISSSRSRRTKYITSIESLRKVHELRAEYDAVLVGAGTIRSDNPELNVRFVEGRSPVKIIIDGNLSSPLGSKVFRTGKTMLFYSSITNEKRKGIRAKVESLEKQGITLISMKSNSKGIIDLKDVMKKIASMNTASVLVEGGGSIFSQFINSKLADKLHLFIAPKILGNGMTFSDGIEPKDLSKFFALRETEVSQTGIDYLLTGYF